MAQQANLKWIEQEWNRFASSDSGRRALVMPEFDLAAVAKLFAAFCIERLAMENAAEEVTLESHTKHVEQFLCEMYATMIDPCEQPKMKVAELCAILLKAARENREMLNIALETCSQLERDGETAKPNPVFKNGKCPTCGANMNEVVKAELLDVLLASAAVVAECSCDRRSEMYHKNV